MRGQGTTNASELLGKRLIAVVWTLLAAWSLYGFVRGSWQSYWLLRDGRRGTAVVLSEHWSGHSSVNYEYVVDGTRYTGHGARNWHEEQYRNVQPGQKSVVYYSASHPWFSALEMPRSTVEGLPVAIIACCFLLLGLAIIFAPQRPPDPPRAAFGRGVIYIFRGPRLPAASDDLTSDDLAN